jgi:hypothetical protein
MRPLIRSYPAEEHFARCPEASSDAATHQYKKQKQNITADKSIRYQAHHAAGALTENGIVSLMRSANDIADVISR